MREKIFYCAFYGPLSAGVAGQQNLSRPVRNILERVFEVIDLSPAQEHSEVVRFPALLAVIGAMHRLLLARLFATGEGGVTVVDMVHSFTALSNAHAHDRFIVLGHDSYALRARRDLAAARGFGARLRLTASWLGWCYVEALLRKIAWQSVFLSPIDRAHAAEREASTIVAIPVSATLRAHGAWRRAAKLPRQPGPLRVLVSLPVRNPSQSRIDRDLVARLLRQSSGVAEVTLWGSGAVEVAKGVPAAQACEVVDWVDDYADFLAGFDLLVYPRMVGSGFHGKLAEALVLGLPCLCADWVAAPLRAVGYEGITSFADPLTFEARVAELLNGLTVAVAGEAPPVLPDTPAAVAPESALAPLVSICAAALTQVEDEGRK